MSVSVGIHTSGILVMKSGDRRTPYRYRYVQVVLVDIYGLAWRQIKGRAILLRDADKHLKISEYQSRIGWPFRTYPELKEDS